MGSIGSVDREARSAEGRGAVGGGRSSGGAEEGSFESAAAELAALRGPWIAAIEQEDVGEVKRISLELTEIGPRAWEAALHECDALWANSPLAIDEAFVRKWSKELGKEGRGPSLARGAHLPHLRATPLELAMVLGKPKLLEGLKEEWARGRRRRGSALRIPLWTAVTDAQGAARSKFSAKGGWRSMDGAERAGLGENLMLHAYLNDRPAYGALARMGFSEQSFRLGLAHAAEHPRSVAAREFKERAGFAMGPVGKALAADFAAGRDAATERLRWALEAMRALPCDPTAKNVIDVLSSGPCVPFGALACAALAGRADVLRGLLEAGANPNAKCGNHREWSMAAEASPEMHRIWVEHGGNPISGGLFDAAWLSMQGPAPILAAINAGNAGAVEALLDGMRDLPLPEDWHGMLAEIAAMEAAANPSIAPRLGRIERLLLDESARVSAMEERDLIEEAAGDGSKGTGSSGSRRL